MYNLPYNVSYKKVRKFFAGCKIPHDGIKLINDRRGRRNGTGYVRFISARKYKEVLQNEGKEMNGTSVRIRPCSLTEYDDAIDSVIPSRDMVSRSCKCGGLFSPEERMSSCIGNYNTTQ
jgi:RNA recognition motif-containing protein